MAKISVIVPVYNTKKYLSRCLDSLLAQTLRGIEIIIIDDGSTDGSGQVCSEYARRDSRITLLSQQNRGQAAARNLGIDRAMESGSEYLAFVDSDDWVLPEYFETLYSISGGELSSVLYFESEKAPAVKDCPVRKVSAEEYYCRSGVLPFVLWGKLYKKDLFSSLRLPDLRHNEDTFFVYRLLFSSKTVNVAFAPLYCYFQNPNGVSASARTADRLSELEAFDEQRAFFRDNGYEKALRHCAVIEGRKMSVLLDKLPGGEKARLEVRLGSLMTECGLKRSEICLK